MSIHITNVADLLAVCADGTAGCTSLHLDHQGDYLCGTKPTNLDSLEQWATDPTRICHAASNSDTCGPRWIIFVRQDGPPTENDASHHLDIRAALACEGVHLIDTVIAWDTNHVSMHQLEKRTTHYTDATDIKPFRIHFQRKTGS